MDAVFLRGSSEGCCFLAWCGGGIFGPQREYQEHHENQSGVGIAEVQHGTMNQQTVPQRHDMCVFCQCFVAYSQKHQN